MLKYTIKTGFPRFIFGDIDCSISIKKLSWFHNLHKILVPARVQTRQRACTFPGQFSEIDTGTFFDARAAYFCFSVQGSKRPMVRFSCRMFGRLSRSINHAALA